MRIWELKKDIAERRLQIAKNDRLLLTHGTKIGKKKQYVLSNCKYVPDSKAKEKEKSEIFLTDVSLLLARELSGMDYAYHNIHLKTSLNYKEDYDILEWSTPDVCNRQKIKEFRLEPRRSCSLVISPTSTVNIAIESTHQPYEFHTPSGLVNFFASCGQIWKYYCNRRPVIDCLLFR